MCNSVLEKNSLGKVASCTSFDIVSKSKVASAIRLSEVTTWFEMTVKIVEPAVFPAKKMKTKKRAPNVIWSLKT